MSEMFYKSFFKRFYDIILSALGLIILSPVYIVLIIAGAVKMKGNPFFVQQRAGRNACVFNLLKFRSMNNKKDADGNLLSDEERLTKYGRFLRATSLDELPQLINILKGDMSVVGPRPLLVKYVPRYSAFQKQRLNVKPGLTGYAQVNGRNAISWEQKFEYDVYYVNHCSLFTDIFVLVKTVLYVFTHKGISSDSSATMEEFMGSEK